MISQNDYFSYLNSKGGNLAEIRKTTADVVENAAFTGNIGYKRVYILDKDKGWHYTDAIFSRHSNVSIAKDQVDSYLQFRPLEHHQVGSYVFIPDDTSFGLDIDTENPLNDQTSNLWLIVGRNNARQFVKYMVIKCNWQFRWIANVGDQRRIMKCWAVARNANSYTSGVWNSDYSTSLDNITSAWFPNLTYVYGRDKLSKYNLADTQTISISDRFMIGLNEIAPNCYMVSKELDMFPVGIIKYTFKQVDFDPKRDNGAYHICDYYDGDGDVNPTIGEDTTTDNHTSQIQIMKINDDSELVADDTFTAGQDVQMYVGDSMYFSAIFSDPNISAQWRITLIDDAQTYTDEQREAIENLMVITQVNPNSIFIRALKSYKLPDKKFNLIVSDLSGDYYSSIVVEVKQK